jgi:signal transduction histidine kinase
MVGAVTQGGAEQEAAARALEQLDAARRRFINVAGHELRTPITTIRGLAEQLATANEVEVADTIAPALLRNARRVESLLDDLLLASDITTALPVSEPEEVDLVATAQAIWDASGATSSLVLEGDAEAPVLIQPESAERILEHLLDNALLYGKPPITLHAETRDGRIVVTCSSGGPVVSNDDLELAFELFYRGEGAVTAAPGFGLGLPVARALARQHGGEVTIAARPQGGVEVTVELPTP